MRTFEARGAVSTRFTEPAASGISLDLLRDPIVVLDAGWHFAYINPAAAALLHRPTAALLGSSLFASLPAEFGAALHAGCQRALDGDGVVVFEVFYEPHGRWLEARAHPSPAGLAVFLRDINEHKRVEESLRERAARDRLLVEQAADGLLIVDEAGDIIEVNTRLCAMFGYPREHLLGRALIDFIDPEDLAARPLRKAELLAGEVLLVERRWRCRDGTTLYVESNSRMLDDRRVQIVVRDISERKQAEAALAASEARYRLLMEHASDGIIVIGSDGRFIEVNARACAMLGYAREELLGCTSRDVIAPENLAARPMVDPDGVGQFLDERPMRRKDGTLFPAEASISRLPNGQSQAIMRDVTERKRLESRLAHQASHDALTGLPNRTLFLERLDLALARTQRLPGRTCAVLFLDLDRFKTINDSLGHAAGDQLLVAVATRLGGVLRETDTLARFGGDEFALLLEDIGDLGRARRLAERLLAALATPFPLAGRELIITTSIGLALSATPDDTPADLLRFADVALYRAKEAGRSCCEVFYPGMNRQAVERLSLEHDLRGALDRGELEVHYQPKVELASGAVVGLEALVRWRGAARGLVSPGDFIAVAEETGLIVPIGRWVLGEACRQLVAWRSQHPQLVSPIVAVNLSPRQFRHPDLARDVAAALVESGLPARLLRLELTETAAMTWPEETLAVLGALKDLGLSLALDDFGTGYSSLAYLQRLPVDVLKVDRSFFADGPRNQAIIKAVADLGHGLGLEVVAEGLETATQVALARAAGFDQGYYFERPRPAEELATLWASGLRCALPDGDISALAVLASD